MNINKMTKEELETLSYNDIAELLLKEKNHITTLELFTEIGKLFGFTKKQIENKIGDFYTALATDKRFYLLEDGKWDLSENHKIADKIIVEDDEEQEDIDTDDYEEEEQEEVTADDLYTDSEDDTADVAEEYKDLVVVDEEELNEVE